MSNKYLSLPADIFKFVIPVDPGSSKMVRRNVSKSYKWLKEMKIYHFIKIHLHLLGN